MNLKPARLAGAWKEGYSLDQQTVSSEFLGYNGSGIPQFDTKRTELGDLMYRLKYRGDRGVVPAIVEAAVEFVKGKAWPVQLLAPMPPSDLARAYQPVWVLGEAIANRLEIDYCQTCLAKTRETPQLKDTRDPTLRARALEGALKATPVARAKIVLLFDDLASSGTTLKAATKALMQGEAKCVYVLTLTRTRTVR